MCVGFAKICIEESALGNMSLLCGMRLKIIFAIGLLCLAVLTNAQEHTPCVAPQTPLPAFMLLKPDSTYFFSEKLPKHRHIIVMLFSPECEHCHRQTQQLKDSIHLFKNTVFIMSSTLPFPLVKKFYQEMGLEQYKQKLVVGRDVLFFLPQYYHSHYLPFTVVYNRAGKNVTCYEGNVSMKDLLLLTK